MQFDIDTVSVWIPDSFDWESSEAKSQTALSKALLAAARTTPANDAPVNPLQFAPRYSSSSLYGGKSTPPEC